MDLNLKEYDITVRDGFALFWGSPLSNWHKCKFEVDGRQFTSSEQYMMYAKAMIFNDIVTAQKILATNDPKKQKALGREVKNFNEGIWDQYKAQIVLEGILEKFTQNVDLQEILLATGDLEIVEASPYDRIWGIGLAADHPDATNPKKWQGQNLLGLILKDVREFLKAEKEAQNEQHIYSDEFDTQG